MGRHATQTLPRRPRKVLKPAANLGPAERNAAESTIRLLDALIARYEPAEADEFIKALHDHVLGAWEDLQKAREAAAPKGDVAELAGPTLSDSERARLLSRLLTREFERRRRLVEESLTAPQVAELLGLSRQAPHDRRKAGRLLAVRVDNAWLYPRWQFDPDSVDGVVPGFDRVLSALGSLQPLEQYMWLQGPKPYFDGRAPIDILRDGDTEVVVHAARGAGVA